MTNTVFEDMIMINDQINGQVFLYNANTGETQGRCLLMKRDYPIINVLETGRHLKSLMMDRNLSLV